MPDLPIACSLDPVAAHDRVARWRAVAARALEHSTATPTGARQRYRADPGVAAELAALVALERRCCPFLHFTLVRRKGAVELEVRGPAEARSILERFAAGA